MIRTLTIQNIALIEHVSIVFYNGFVVLSGETGAGKSIIIDAVNLILGGRADKTLIRSGCDKASVEAEFEIHTFGELKNVLEKEGIEQNGDSVILYREFSMNGRNICRINGIMVSVSVMKQVAAFLVNLHGQSEHQFLADEEKQLSYLDKLGNEQFQALKENVRRSYERFIRNHRNYAKLVKMNEGKEYRTDFLKNELDNIRRLEIRPGEENKLSEETKHLLKSSRIHERLFRAYKLLGNGNEEGDSFHNLQNAARDLRSLENEDPEFSQLADLCENLSYSLEDILFRIETLNRQYDFDPSLLERVENRLESVRKILRKYGPSEEDVLRNEAVLENEYNTLTGLDEQLEKTRAEHKALLHQYRSDAKLLTEARHRIAADFREKMMNELRDLGMNQTLFDVRFESESATKPLMPTPEGDDRISFLISPNPGEPLKPISSIASGGELSRLMLALKTIESDSSAVRTMIFDEIDTGISGQVAQAVAEKIMTISRMQQVICISHLPQIAAAADHQYLVFKGVKGSRTFTEVTELGPEKRIEEIARMISGAQGISPEAKDYAKQLISSSAAKNRTADGTDGQP